MRFGSLHGVESERKDRTLKVTCYRGRDETGELELEDRKVSEYCLPDSQARGGEASPTRESCYFDKDSLVAFRILDNSNCKERRGCLEIGIAHYSAHPIILNTGCTT